MIDESIIGKRFGKLVVISFHHSNKYKITYMYEAEVKK